MIDFSSADLTDPVALDWLMLLWIEQYLDATDLGEKMEAAGKLAFFGMMMRNVERRT